MAFFILYPDHPEDGGNQGDVGDPGGNGVPTDPPDPKCLPDTPGGPPGGGPGTPPGDVGGGVIIEPPDTPPPTVPPIWPPEPQDGGGEPPGPGPGGDPSSIPGGGGGPGTVLNPPGGPVVIPGNGGGGGPTVSNSADAGNFVSVNGQAFDTENSVYLPTRPPDRTLEYFDSDYNIQVATDPRKANVAGVLAQNDRSSDPYSLFNRKIPKVYKDVLDSSRTISYVPYNGVTLGSFIYATSLMGKTLSENTKSVIKSTKLKNNSSLVFDTLLTGALKKAIVKNKVKEYSIPFFEDMKTASRKLAEPIQDTSQFSFLTANQSVALTRIRKARRSMLARSYQDGSSQREVQSRHMIPSDYNLTVPIYSLGGNTTQIKVQDDDTISVVNTSGETISIPQLHDFVQVESVSGTTTVGLISNRKLAYAFGLPDLSIIHSYMKQAAGSNNTGLSMYSFSLDVSAPAVSEQTTQTIKGSYLLKLDLSSLVKGPSQVATFKKTDVTYSSVWEDGDDVSGFNATVSSYSGPRNTVFINEEDPWWNTFLNSTGEVSATYLDMEVDGFDGFLYPRRVNMDILLVPSSKIEYTPFLGESKIVSYTNQESVRSLTVMIAPTNDVLGQNYVKKIRKEDETNFNGKPDLNSFQYSKGIDTSALTLLTLGSTAPTITSSKSPLGVILGHIDNIKNNYNLRVNADLSAIPHMDVFSFLSISEIVDFVLRTPSITQSELFFGTFNGLELFPILKFQVEKSYISAARLTGTSLAASRLYDKLPSISNQYYPLAYKNILYR
tara:strand:+ start:33848 stop:36184 length:2337 start_codon:yes stop_codon:yes gene_type:complete